MQRRKFLLTTGAATTALLAGCTGDDEEEDDADLDDAEAEAAEDEDGNGGDEEEEGDGGDEEDDIDPEEALEDEDTESTVEGLELVEHELVSDEFSAQVEGVVANETGEELGYVEVGVVLYNEEEQRIGDSFTNTTDLPDGQEWAFEVLLTEDADDIDDYDITVTDSAF
ncbi:FxLYD domain-containing protein [Halalkalicoccus tibetensis]|uniref:FxLYD domain-containing protein n=1 Tax=Halalkalicoccus tibetensis TaxID=175632 RepID=A0ABD5V7X6_9EURY